MTIASQLRPVGVDLLTDALALLRRQGVRLTGSRQAVLEVLFADATLRTAEEIASVAYVDLASAYRNLETLEQLGLVRHIHLGHGPGRYVLSGAAEAGYVTCEQCGAVAPLDALTLAAVREVVFQHTGFEPRFTHFPIVGRCGTCAATTIEEDHHHAV